MQQNKNSTAGPGPSPSTIVFTLTHGTSKYSIMASPFSVYDRVPYTVETICLLKFWNFITYKTGATTTTHDLIAHVPDSLGGRGETVHMVNAITWVAHLQRCQNAGWYDVNFDIQEREAGAAEPEAILDYIIEIHEMECAQQRRNTKEIRGSVEDSNGTVCDKVFMFLMLVVAVCAGMILGSHAAGSKGPPGNGPGQQLA
ncbi:hypothetical protein HBI70_075150 [Parastagonospora nodorum]|nr:hypothetical protein HBH51_160710 [Parastagonospora nodorum]KAH3997478.1 hypothetical protein HBI10_144320 [Parastagonospora nodorum]KAH4021183.1 hypothetical protein HBI13_112620 [Parastagonospora nodorum]KAH4107925.1 hypothetical protein HBH46_055340 [Parastagonospora nodorum]KAH4176566.1 hypothetical protein HBH43_060620 [Parastagonospora nodorum]